MKREFELTDAHLFALLEASRPTPYLVANGTEPMSPREQAMRVWEEIGAELGFVPVTAEPIPGRPDRFFAASPIEDAP